MFHQGSQSSFQVARVHLGIPLELLQGFMASSPVEGGNSVFLSSWDRISGFLSCFNRGVRPRPVLRHGTLFSF